VANIEKEKFLDRLKRWYVEGLTGESSSGYDDLLTKFKSDLTELKKRQENRPKARRSKEKVHTH